VTQQSCAPVETLGGAHGALMGGQYETQLRI
jgi:hypothetical protein